MRLALPGSALVHAAIVAALLIGFVWPDPDDAPAGTPVTVDIISLSEVSSNSSEIIESDSTVSAVSAGSEVVNPTPSEVIEPVATESVTPTTEVLEPVEPETPPPETAEPLEPVEPPTTSPPPSEVLEPQPAPVAEPVAATTLASLIPQDIAIAPAATPQPSEITELAALAQSELAALAATPVPSEPVEPVGILAPEPLQPVGGEAVTTTASLTPQVLEPVSSEPLKMAPMPHTLSFERPSAPTQPQRRPPPTRQPAAEPPQRPQTSAGNGGNSNADAVAASSAGQQGNSGSGGSADLARYPAQVLSKLRRALRYPRDADGASGEVHVQFAVSANGAPSGIRVVQSSGSAAIDAAGIATVNRAAPFPAIPAGSDRNSWTFTVPLAFQR